MTLFSDSGAADFAEDFRPDRSWPPAGGGDYLDVDDVLSRGGDDLGLDIDPAGYLVLIEGADFD